MQKEKEKAATNFFLLFTYSIYSHRIPVEQVCYLYTFKLKTFKDVQVYSYAQSHQFVHRSGTHYFDYISDK